MSQNGDVYMASELPRKNIGQVSPLLILLSEGDLRDLHFSKL